MIKITNFVGNTSLLGFKELFYFLVLNRFLFFLCFPPPLLDLLPELFNLPLDRLRFILNFLPGFGAFLYFPFCLCFRFNNLIFFFLLFESLAFALPWKGFTELNNLGFLYLPEGAAFLALSFLLKSTAFPELQAVNPDTIIKRNTINLPKKIILNANLLKPCH